MERFAASQNLSPYPTHELVEELSHRMGEIKTPDGLVVPYVYDLLLTKLKPIPCVDVIPVRFDDSESKIGVITRATGAERGKQAILGGGVNLGERMLEAAGRHLRVDLGISSFRLYGTQTENTPYLVQQYLPGNKTSPDQGYDPSKHAIAATYLVVISGEPIPQKEQWDFIGLVEMKYQKKLHITMAWS